MSDFNFKRAWREGADPAFRALPAKVLRIIEDVTERHVESVQGPTLAIKLHPDDLYDFAELDTLTLARAARVVHDWGHWHSGRKDEDATSWKSRMLQHGGGWKFANLADQILAERCKLRSRFEETGRGVSFRIIEGVIRAQVSGKDFWTWKEIGMASEELAERLVSGSRPAGARDWKSIEDWLAELRQDERKRGSDDRADLLIDAGERWSEEKIPCKRCKISAFGEELCAEGHCKPGVIFVNGKGCCTCNRGEMSDDELREEIRARADAKVADALGKLDREGLERAIMGGLYVGGML